MERLRDEAVSAIRSQEGRLDGGLEVFHLLGAATVLHRQPNMPFASSNSAPTAQEGFTEDWNADQLAASDFDIQAVSASVRAMSSAT